MQIDGRVAVRRDELDAFAEGRALPGKQQLKVRYITQARIAPPTFVLFTNAKKAKLHFSYQRYVENRLRESYGFFATPIRVVGRAKAK